MLRRAIPYSRFSIPYSRLSDLQMKHHVIGFYLALLQFLFTTTWTVYVIFLPALAAKVVIGKEQVTFILLADQFVFVLMDFAMGVMADRVSRLLGRLGRVVL